MIDDLFETFDDEFGRVLNKLLYQFAKLSTSKIVIKHSDEEVQYTLKEIQFLGLIFNNPGMKNIDIAERLGVTKGMISKIIKNLESKDVILKKTNPDNNREIQLFIKDVGKSHLISFTSIINPSVLDMYQDWFTIPHQYRTTFQLILEKYTNVLIKLDSKK